MPFTIEAFGKIRPFVYHLTSRKNLARIKRTSSLVCAADLLKKAGEKEIISAKRKDPVKIQVDGESVYIRDQAPLHKGNARFEGGWEFDDLIRDLNGRVFFWPGTTSGPIAYGLRHFERYADEKPVVIRVGLAELVEANNDREPLFCKFNSGSPRCSGGLGSLRGPNTFVPCSKAEFTSSTVVEVTYLDHVVLPRSSKSAGSPNGPWRKLW